MDPFSLIGLILAGVGLVTGGVAGGVAHDQNIEQAQRDREDLRTVRAQARELAAQQRQHARESYHTSVEHFEESMAEQRVTAGKQQATGERQAGQAIFDTMLAGGRATGETEANLAGTSGLRRGGSVETVIEEVEEDYSIEVERQEERLSSNQDLFDTQLEQSFAAEERQIDEWTEQFDRTIESINLNRDQLIDRLNTDIGYLSEDIGAMNTFEGWAGSILGGADVGRFGNALANYAAGLPEAPDTTYTSTTYTPGQADFSWNPTIIRAGG